MNEGRNKSFRDCGMHGAVQKCRLWCRRWVEADATGSSGVLAGTGCFCALQLRELPAAAKAVYAGSIQFKN
ncbi:hypothetical protein V6N13_064656 [Hibiscus sabdariffa]